MAERAVSTWVYTEVRLIDHENEFEWDEHNEDKLADKHDGTATKRKRRPRIPGAAEEKPR